MLDHTHIKKGDIVLYRPSPDAEDEEQKFFRVERKTRKRDTGEIFFHDRADNIYLIYLCCKIPKGNHCYVRLFCQWYAGRFIRFIESNLIKAEVTVNGEKQTVDASAIWMLWGNEGEKSYLDIYPCEGVIEECAYLMAEAVRLSDRAFLESLRANFEAATLKQATNMLLNPAAKKQIYEWVVEMNKEKVNG